MTGFAKRQCQLSNRKITIEIKTLNSKSLDLIIKAPALLRSKELEIRNMLNRLERGKVEVFFTDEADAATSANLNKDLVIERYRQLQDIACQLNCSSQHLLDSVLAMPDVWGSNNDDELSDQDWSLLSRTIDDAITDVDLFRQHEGSVLQKDFVKHIDLIEQMLGCRTHTCTVRAKLTEAVPANHGRAQYSGAVNILVRCPSASDVAREADDERHGQKR